MRSVQLMYAVNSSIIDDVGTCHHKIMSDATYS